MAESVRAQCHSVFWNSTEVNVEKVVRSLLIVAVADVDGVISASIHLLCASNNEEQCFPLHWPSMINM